MFGFPFFFKLQRLPSVFIFAYLLILCNTGFSTFNALERRNKCVAVSFLQNSPWLFLLVSGRWCHYRPKTRRCHRNPGGQLCALTNTTDCDWFKRFFSVIYYVCLSNIILSVLWVILYLFLVGFFVVFFYSCIGSTANAVVNGTKKNATWSFSFSADAFHSSNTHPCPSWDVCLYLLSPRSTFVTSSNPSGHLGVNKCSLGLWVECPCYI